MSDNLYRRGDTWHLKITIRGKRHRCSLQTTVRAEARRRRDKIVAELNHASFHGETRHSWREAVVKWSEEFLPGIAPGTARRYVASLGQFEHLLADLHLDEINTKLIARIASRKGASNATRRRDLTALSSVLRCCTGWGWMESNPARTYDRSIIPERRDPIHLPRDEDVAVLVEALSPGLGRLVRFLDLTGCRLEEAAALEHAQLRLDRQEATLLKTKRQRVRTIRLTNPATPQGVGTKEGTPQHLVSPYVFWHGAEKDQGSRYHNLPSLLGRVISKLVAAKKIRKFRIHDLRHRFAVRWLEAGGDIYALKLHLGHTSVKTTEIYLQFVPWETQNARNEGTKEGTADRGLAPELHGTKPTKALA